MMRLFGKRKEDPKPQEVDLPEAILRNKSAIQTLEKRQIHLEKRILAQEEDAKRRAKDGDKRGALFALKRKKMYEKELEALGNAHLTLEQQIMTLESAQTQQVAVGALAAGVVAQKALNQQLNLTKIDDLMDDLQEQAAIQTELAQVLTQGNILADDKELLEELHLIEERQLEEALVDAVPVPQGLVGSTQMELNSSRPKTTSPQKDLMPMSDEDQLRLLLSDLS